MKSIHRCSKSCFTILPVKSLAGQINLPGDKSISHRAVIISSLASGKTEINNFLFSQDCLYTISSLKALGVRILLSLSDKRIIVYGKGLFGFKKPKRPIYVGESGTTLRILLGVLAGQKFESVLRGAPSLSSRPMRRVIFPLRLMGTEIKSRILGNDEYLPIRIKGGVLNALRYKLPMASAQVKSALLLAGLYCKNETKIIEPLKSRDHTERMLKLFGVNININDLQYSIKGSQQLRSPGKINVPGDISSASFFIVAAAILPDSKLEIKKVCLNPTRIGIIDVLKRMGADIRLKVIAAGTQHYEPIGDVVVRSSSLKGTNINKCEVPFLIDELPVIMVAACLSKGMTRIYGVEELRVKETDRINSMVINLRKMGADIKTGRGPNSIIIKGVKRLKSARLNSCGDHRTAMSLIIAALTAKGQSKLDDAGCIAKSFPEFLPLLKKISLP